MTATVSPRKTCELESGKKKPQLCSMRERSEIMHVCSKKVNHRRCLKEGMRGRAWDEVKSYGAHFNRSG